MTPTIKHKINFAAGPAAIPSEVLAQASAAIINYEQSGLSILEIQHRNSALFDQMLEEARELVLELSQLDGAEYEVLWLQGGGRLQFAMIPMNFLNSDATAGYIDSGHWAYDALQNASLYGHVRVLGSSRDINYQSLPTISSPISNDLAYVHLTTNNTIYGTQIQQIPDCPVPLIADMSSDIFSQKRNYAAFDLFYAVAQKNMGAAGVTLVVIRKNMLHKIVRTLPPILDYKQQALAKSVLNTPPVFNIYVSLLTLRWIKNKGIESITKENEEKAQILYDEIDRNRLFSPIAHLADRSKMNVVFSAVSAEIEAEFISFAQGNNIEGIVGHRSVGGFRVSLYNAISKEQTQELVRIMQSFEQEKLK